MASNLWSKGGAYPVELPFQDALEDGTVLTNLAGNADSREALGWVQAPDAPDYDPIIQGLGWSDAGWTVISIVPQQVSRMQAYYVLKMTPGQAEGRTMFQDFDDAIRATGNVKLINFWENVSDFHRYHPDLISFATSQGMSSGQLDDLFIAAAAVT